MTMPKVLILRAPGTNCDEETAYAFEKAGANPVLIHVNQLIEDASLADDCQILCFPGGFSYGDDIAAGRILAQKLSVHLQEMVERFRSEDRLVLGICNGFQVMMRLGIFFPSTSFADREAKPPATLTWNQQGRFEDRWVYLRVSNSNSVFLRDVEQMYLPMAHAEGRFVIADAESQSRLLENNQLGLRYCQESGKVDDAVLPFPANPNGADLNVAGISDPTGRVFGLMPHPERHIDATNHPAWTRRSEQPEFGEGLKIFQTAVAFFA